MPWQVRRLLEQDLPAVRALHIECLGKAQWLPPAARSVSPHEFEHAAIAPQEEGWVALSAPGECLGFIAFQPQARFVRNLFVQERARGQGVGRALLSALPVGEPWQLKCVQANTAALDFYRALGWGALKHGRSADGPWVLLESPQGHP
jgi:GNAT superfamily N-acetyltransferase